VGGWHWARANGSLGLGVKATPNLPGPCRHDGRRKRLEKSTVMVKVAGGLGPGPHWLKIREGGLLSFRAWKILKWERVGFIKLGGGRGAAKSGKEIRE